MFILSTARFDSLIFNRSLLFSCVWQLLINEYDDADYGVFNINCGVPQGSVLVDPRPEGIHQLHQRSTLSSTHMDFAITLHWWCTYIAVSPAQVQTIAPRLQECIVDINYWCGSRRLQLNALKTEAVWFGSTYLLLKLSQKDKTVVIGNKILPADSVSDLRAYLDTVLADIRFNNTCRAMLCA